MLKLSCELGLFKSERRFKDANTGKESVSYEFMDDEGGEFTVYAGETGIDTKKAANQPSIYPRKFDLYVHVNTYWDKKSQGKKTSFRLFDYTFYDVEKPGSKPADEKK